MAVASSPTVGTRWRYAAGAQQLPGVVPVESPLCIAGLSSLATCLGVLGCHGRVRVGQKRDFVAVEAILPHADAHGRNTLTQSFALCCVSEFDARTGLLPLNVTLRSEIFDA